jgi:hypothetical protein
MTSLSISIPSQLEKSDGIGLDNKIPSHIIFAESGTTTICIYCKYAEDALMHLFFKYQSEWQKYPFYYITHIWDRNSWAYDRCKNELGMVATPSVYWDGGWRKNDKPGIFNTQIAIERYRKSIRKCANRTVADIDLTIDGTWLGAVNENVTCKTENGSLICILQWTNTEIIVNISVDNNEKNQYNGHLHVYVCDNQSSMGWYDRNDTLFTMAFLDYAYNENITLHGGESWDGSKNWDGMDHTNGTHFYENVTESNTWIVASLFNRDNNYYSDETAGYRLAKGTDPKTFTVYFGNSTPPSLAIENTSIMSYISDKLDFNTTYYWRVDVWNKKGEQKKGTIWSFTTRDNNPPNTPSNPYPSNGSKNSSICGKFNWSGGDPDNDNVTYDLYLGECGKQLEKIASNITSSYYNFTQLLEFNTCYIWKIVAWDEFGYIMSGPIWMFITQQNLPPYVPSDPFPKDGDAVPANITLRWDGGDPNPCDLVTYDVYLGTTTPLPKVSSNQTRTWFDPGILNMFETYYWKVIAWDSGGLLASGPKWSFTTGDNKPPGPPKIEGPSPRLKLLPKPFPGTHEFTFCAIDPDDDMIYYYIDWGDGTYEDWIGPFLSGEKVSVNHTYEEKGTFTIRAKAKDIWDQEGTWGTYQIPIQRNDKIIYLLLQKWFINAPLVQRLLDCINTIYDLMKSTC